MPTPMLEAVVPAPMPEAVVLMPMPEEAVRASRLAYHEGSARSWLTPNERKTGAILSTMGSGLQTAQ